MSLGNPPEGTKETRDLDFRYQVFPLGVPLYPSISMESALLGVVQYKDAGSAYQESDYLS